MRTPTFSPSLLKTPYVLGVLLIIGVFAALELTDTTHVFHKGGSGKPAVSASQSTKGEPSNDGGEKSSESNKDDPTATPSDSTPEKNIGSSSSLIAPTGNFVSAHSNVPVSAALSSVCNTTSGAECRISFESGGTTKSLPAQIVDAGGSAYWNSWTPKSIGLTPGRWKVQAIAALGSATRSSDDAMDLVVTE